MPHGWSSVFFVTCVLRITLAFCLRRKQKQLFPQTEALWVVQGFGTGQNLTRWGQRRNLNHLERRLKIHVHHKAQLLTDSRFGRPAAPLPAHHRNHELLTGQASPQAIPFPFAESCTGFTFSVGLLFSLLLRPPICYQQPAEGGGFAPASLLPTCSPLGGPAAHNEFP